MEKDINIAVLLGFYGKMLTEKQYRIMESYYLYDNSLGEIAETLAITRQSVRDAILKATRTLAELDEKLGFRLLTDRAVEILRNAQAAEPENTECGRMISDVIKLLEE